MSLKTKVKNYLNEINPWRTINTEQIVDSIHADKQILDVVGLFDGEDAIVQYITLHVNQIIESLIQAGEVRREINGYIRLNKDPNIDEQNKIYTTLLSNLKYAGCLAKSLFVDSLFVVPLNELKTRANEMFPFLKIYKVDTSMRHNMIHYMFHLPAAGWTSARFCRQIVSIDPRILKVRPKVHFSIANGEEFLLNLVKKDKNIFEYIHEPELLGNAVELFQAAEKPFNFDEKTEENSLVCSICQLNKIKVVFRCGHTTCFSCSGRLPSCPTCRKGIKTRQRVFL